MSPVPEEPEQIEWLLTSVVKYREGNQGNPDAQLTISYDTLHRPIRVAEETRELDAGFVNFVTKNIEYDDKGQIIKMSTVGGLEEWNHKFDYNEGGLLKRFWREATPVEAVYSYEGYTIIGNEILKRSNPELPVDTNRNVYTFDANNNLSHLKIYRIKGEDNSLSWEINAEFTNYDQKTNPWAAVNIGNLHIWEIFNAIYQMNREPRVIDGMPFLSSNNPSTIKISSTSYRGDEPSTRENTYEIEYGYDENGLVTQEILYHVDNGDYLVTNYTYTHIDEID